MDRQGGQVRVRLRHAAARSLVGRAREQAALLSMLRRGDGPAVVFVSGPGGIGKSTTVAGATAALEHRALTLDGRVIEPTASGFLGALARELGCGRVSSVADAGRALDRADVGTLVVDSFERLNLLDGWLRNDLLVALPADLTTVVVGPLDDRDARLLVDRRGLPPDAAARVLRFGRGHPLALELLAEALARHPQLDLPGGPPAEVVEELFEVLLDDLDPRERRTVENAAVLRRITQPLLAAVLTDAGGGAPAGPDLKRAWRPLRDLPFTRITSTGVEFEPVARHVVAGALEIRDPARVRDLRRRAAEAALRDAERGRSWDATADLLYLVQNPIIRNSYVPPDGEQHPVEAVAADDLPAVLAITERYDGPAGAAVVEDWWRSHRADFVVGRGHGGAVTAFSVLVSLAEVDGRLSETDPVLAAFVADVRDRPLPAGGTALVHRRALGCGAARSRRPSSARWSST
ncbi:MAG: transcriptional regulator, LuxR family [Pseudonocardia sp.]|nr:transcriptional regulator, LuxR family [Pseudonocardia sp.]